MLHLSFFLILGSLGSIKSSYLGPVKRKEQKKSKKLKEKKEENKHKKIRKRASIH